MEKIMENNESVKRGRGRPKGSKNKPKPQVAVKSTGEIVVPANAKLEQLLWIVRGKLREAGRHGMSIQAARCVFGKGISVPVAVQNCKRELGLNILLDA